MLTPYTVTADAWIAISAAGESGTCWVQSKSEESQGGPKNSIVLNHSEDGSGSLDVENSYFMPDSKKEITFITPDSPTDVFYVRCVVVGREAVLIADVN